MVSENPSNVATRSDRGIIAEETIVAASTGVNNLDEYPLPSFWGSIVAGAVVVMSIGALSECLMFACRVGTYGNGQVYLGAGAAFWMFITTCVAFFFGGMVASRLSLRGGWMRGLTVWAFTLPLLMLVTAFISGGAGLGFVHNTRIAEEVITNNHITTFYGGGSFVSYGGVWSGFILLALGLIFSLVGAYMPSASQTDRFGAGVNRAA